jgi:hypothetical protein
MKAIFALILAAIGLYIGVNLLPGLNTTISTITTPTYSSGVTGMVGVTLIVFAAMLVILIVAAMKESFNM